MAKKVAITNQKGGVGKTTIAYNVAHALHREGNRVLVVNLDPQDSIEFYAALRDADDDHFAVVSMGEKADREIAKIERSFDWIIIDGAPVVDMLAAAAIRAADVVLIPVQPSELDLHGSRSLVDLIQVRQSVTGGFPRAAFVVSKGSKTTISGRTIRKEAAEMGLPVFRNGTVSREDYKTVVKTGRSVIELGDSNDACFEFKKIVNELKEFANG